MRSGFVLEKPVLPPIFRSTRSHSIKRDATPLLYSSKMAQAMLTHDETRKRLIYSTGVDKSILKELQEHKNCPFCSKTLKRFTSRKNNLEYFVCGESCPFFTKASQLPEYVQILARVVRDCYKKFHPFVSISVSPPCTCPNPRTTTTGHSSLANCKETKSASSSNGLTNPQGKSQPICKMSIAHSLVHSSKNRSSSQNLWWK